MFIWQNFQPAYRDPGNRASPPSHKEHIKVFTKDLEVRRDLEKRASPVNRAHMKRLLVYHMFSVYIEIFSGVAEDEKEDRKAHLAIRWINSLNSYLEGSSDNAKVCSPV